MLTGEGRRVRGKVSAASPSRIWYVSEREGVDGGRKGQGREQEKQKKCHVFSKGNLGLALRTERWGVARDSDKMQVVVFMSE